MLGGTLDELLGIKPKTNAIVEEKLSELKSEGSKSFSEREKSEDNGVSVSEKILPNGDVSSRSSEKENTPTIPTRRNRRLSNLLRNSFEKEKVEKEDNDPVSLIDRLVSQQEKNIKTPPSGQSESEKSESEVEETAEISEDEVKNEKIEEKPTITTKLFDRSKTPIKPIRPETRQISKRPTSSYTFSDSTTLRTKTYEDWLRRKQLAAAEKLKEKEALKKKKIEEKEEKERKRQSATKNLERWRETKDEEIKRKAKEKKEREQLKNQQEKEEKEEKTTAAEKIFKSWKEDKDRKLRSSSAQKRRKEQDIKEKQEEERTQKLDDAQKCFQQWKQIKNREISSVVRRVRSAQDLRQNVTERQKLNREQRAADVYNAWLERKEQEDIEQAYLRSAGLDSKLDDRPPFIPANNTIPNQPKLRRRRIKR